MSARSDLPPPAPPLTFARLRGWLATFFAWSDRRQERRLDRAWLLRQDEQWREQYTAWWLEHGWRDGAPTPDVAWRKLRASRR